jgi:hypothetical protein
VCENFLYSFKAARWAARAAASAPWPSLPLALPLVLPLVLPLRPGPAPVGWREKQSLLGPQSTDKVSTAASEFDKGTLAMAHTGLNGGRREASPIRRQAYGPSPLVKSRHSVRTAARALPHAGQGRSNLSVRAYAGSGLGKLALKRQGTLRPSRLALSTIG